MPPPAAWSPLLDERLRGTASKVLEGITEALTAPERLASLDPYLFRGRSGVALLFGALAHAHAEPRHTLLAERLLEEATQAVATLEMIPDLFAGFSGIAWAVEHLQGTLDPEEDPLTDIDEALGGLLRTRPWTYHHDLVSGLVGLGVYALERLPRAQARRCLEALVARLDELAEPTEHGLRWWTPAPLVPEHLRVRYPDGAACLGVAHGIPGVLVVLAGAVAAGIAPSRSRALLEGGWSWLMAQRLPDAAASRFPTWLGADTHSEATRPAWCYGDPGLAYSLLLVARTVGEAAWEQQALALCHEAARRWSDASQVRDAGLCHGAAGLGHLYNRLFQATGEPLFADVARAWFERTLAFFRPGEGVGGFLARDFTPEAAARPWVEDPSLLTGSAGIGLALLAALSPREPTWDRMLLLSLPPLSPRAP